MKRMILLLLALLLVAAPLAGQEPEPIEACDAFQFLDTVNAIREDNFTADLDFIHKQLGSTQVSRFNVLIDSLFDIHERWIDEIRPKFPNCIEAVGFAAYITDYINEAMISASLGKMSVLLERSAGSSDDIQTYHDQSLKYQEYALAHQRDAIELLNATSERLTSE